MTAIERKIQHEDELLARTAKLLSDCVPLRQWPRLARTALAGALLEGGEEVEDEKARYLARYLFAGPARIRSLKATPLTREAERLRADLHALVSPGAGLHLLGAGGVSILPSTKESDMAEGGAGKLNVSIGDAMAITRRLLELHHKKHGSTPGLVVLLGGTALGAHGIRLSSADVDLYMPDSDLDIIDQVQREGRKKFGDSFQLDATSAESAWGQFTIRDIAKSPVVETLTAGGHVIPVMAITPETVFVLKCATRRTKDREDFRLIADATSADKLIDRFNEMAKWHGDPRKMPEIAIHFADQVSKLYSLERREVERRMTLADVVRRQMRDLRAAQEKRDALVLQAALRRVERTVRALPGGKRFTADLSKVSEEARRVAEDRPDLLQKALKIIYNRQSER